jgi:ubiquinone/menaquinone biosynthesis C-methylase UbiE
MSDGIEFNEEAARHLEAVYLTPDVVEQRCQTLRALNLRPGERVLDIGSGPGLLAKDMAATVGPEGAVVGIDVSDAMLNIARNRCDGFSWVHLEHGDATSLRFDDESFDVGVSTQVYEYVLDIPNALAELHRVLRPGGRAVIVDTDYDSWVVHTSDAKRFARVRAAWDDHFVHGGLPRVLIPELRKVGFEVLNQEVIPMFNTEYHSHTYSYGMVQLIADFVAGKDGVGPAEAKSWKADLAELGKRGEYFFSLNRYLFVAHKPD